MKITRQHEWQQRTEIRSDRGQKKQIEPSSSSLLFLHLDEKKQRWSGFNTNSYACRYFEKNKQIKNGGDVIFGHSALWPGQSWTGRASGCLDLDLSPLSLFQDWTYFGEERWGDDNVCLKELVCSAWLDWTRQVLH